MALSENEQRLLEEMERNLLQEDASLDQKLKRVGSVNRSAGKLVAGVLTMIAGIGLLIFAVATQVTFMGVVAFIVNSSRSANRKSDEHVLNASESEWVHVDPMTRQGLEPCSTPVHTGLLA